VSSGRPLVTLAAAGAGFAVLLGVNMATTPQPAVVADAPAAATSSPAAPSSTAAQPPQPATPAQTAPPTGPVFPAEAVYAGRAADGRTTVAVAVWSGKAAAYICDGRSVESWLTGTASGGTASLTGQGSTLTARKTPTGIATEFTVGGRAYTATAVPATKPAGLYRGRSGSTTIGWIVLPDGTQVGIASSGGMPQSAPSLTPGQPATVDGTQVTGQEVRGDEQF
jgi:hypothetical protein